MNNSILFYTAECINEKTRSHVYPYTQQQIARRPCLYLLLYLQFDPDFSIDIDHLVFDKGIKAIFIMIGQMKSYHTADIVHIL